MVKRIGYLGFCAVIASGMASSSALAINLVVDYSYASAFFSPSTTDGQQARATVEAAADYFSDILDDTFSSVVVPEDYISTAPFSPPLTTTWNWRIIFDDPSTGDEVVIPNPTIAEDEYRLYVGAQTLPESQLAEAGPGGAGRGYSASYYFQSQLDEIISINDAFEDSVDNRGESSGFSSWGGTVSFNSSSNWHFDHKISPPSGKSDLFSTALHEIGHTLGLAGTSEWNSFISTNGTFIGPASVNANGGPVALNPPDGAHWAENTMSTVFGGTSPQEAAMDPDLLVGSRKLWTTLDSAALTDIGWTVSEPTPLLAGDYNDDGSVDAADYTVWRDNLGGSTPVGTYSDWAANYGSTAPTQSIPEPTTAVLLVVGLASCCLRR